MPPKVAKASKESNIMSRLAQLEIGFFSSFSAAAVYSTNEANKAGLKQSIIFRCLWCICFHQILKNWMSQAWPHFVLLLLYFISSKLSMYTMISDGVNSVTVINHSIDKQDWMLQFCLDIGNPILNLKNDILKSKCCMPSMSKCVAVRFRLSMNVH